MGEASDSGASEKIVLSLKEIINNSDYAKYDAKYQIMPYGDYYYTVIPIYAYSNYDANGNYVGADGRGEKVNINVDELSTDIKDINNSNRKRIVVYDGVDETGTISYIDVIGINSEGTVITDGVTNKIVEKIGIAINAKNTDTVIKEDVLKNKTLTVYFDGRVAKTYYPISIIEQAISEIKYKMQLSDVPTTCFKETTIARVSSGDRQEDFTDLSEVNCIVNKVTQTGGTETIGTEILDTKTANSAEGVTITKELDTDTGEITIKIMSENPGKFAVTPYIEINGNKVMPRTVNGNAVNRTIIEIKENQIVNTAYFLTDGDGSDIENGMDLSIIRNKLESLETYGVANISVINMKAVVFAHDYSKELGKTGLPTRIVKNVNQQNVIIEPKSNMPESMKVQKLITGQDGEMVAIKEGDENISLPLRGVAITVPADATPGSTANFSLVVKNTTDVVDNYTELDNIVVQIGPKVTLNVEDKRKINIYTENNYNSPIDEDIVEPLQSTFENADGEYETFYYTLVKVGLNSNGNNVAINKDNISVKLDAKGTPGIITFIDNVNEEGLTDYDIPIGTVVISIKGFKKVGDDYLPCDTEDDIIEYVGIAVSSDNMAFLETADCLKSITVYYGNDQTRVFDVALASGNSSSGT